VIAATQVSVVMSVYNDARHLGDSIQSILGQTFMDFEFIVVNDGSTDGSREVLAEYENRDARIRVLDQCNLGLTQALIRGCDEARGHYIARQDADDISAPERLADQTAYLDAHPEVSLVSSWAEALTDEGERFECARRPTSPEQATQEMIEVWQGPPAHGTVMMRTDAYRQVGGYRWQFYFGQDSDLWLRLVDVGLIGYVPKVLYAYRRSPNSISSENRAIQRQFGRLGRRCLDMRRAGQDEAPLLETASQPCATIDTKNVSQRSAHGEHAATLYLIGCGLARHGNRQALKYFWRIVKRSPLHWRAWARFVYHAFGLGLRYHEQTACSVTKAKISARFETLDAL